ncbi:MAG: tRNA preQ1(34) S-adenosylmethionine ribosyltransferase-isomerase QueA [Verrucomicrobia bacterium]|nr:tRNA preQ1(34) S-adenosylmethionine ribosyltransferase-isomerase QueA [Verrucomicrobiota bacterium]
MRTAEFDYYLPPELIAQAPTPQRDLSRLLVLNRPRRTLEHSRLRDFVTYLQAGDVVVLNNSRVIPARLRGVKTGSGGQIEVLLTEELAVNDWWVMLRPGKRVRMGTAIEFRDVGQRPAGITATITAKNEEGLCRLHFTGVPDVKDALERLGEMPLPPYIERPSVDSPVNDRERYQTVFAREPGSVAAPTAGLHFTSELLARLRERGVHVSFVTLHVGLGTFAPVKAECVEQHHVHEERFELPAETARTIRQAKHAGHRVFAVGTTTLRVLETVAAGHRGELGPCRGRTALFVYPPHEFKVADALLTNFHLPKSTLLMLVSAFASPGETHGRESVLSAYAEAIRERYRFYSYGDAMLLL